jgi:hypothetical protein
MGLIMTNQRNGDSPIWVRAIIYLHISIMRMNKLHQCLTQVRRLNVTGPWCPYAPQEILALLYGLQQIVKHYLQGMNTYNSKLFMRWWRVPHHRMNHHVPVLELKWLETMRSKWPRVGSLVSHCICDWGVDK